MHYNFRKPVFLVVSLLLMVLVMRVMAKPPPLQQSPPLFALCHDTHDTKKRSLAQQADMLAELGYDGVGHLWFDKVEDRLKTLDEHGLRLFQIYERINLGASPGYDKQRYEELLPLLKGRDVQIALLMSGGSPSDDSLDNKAVSVLREMADKAAPFGVSLLIYPHRTDWAETLDDAVRVAKKVDRKNVGAMFNLCHWGAVDKEKNLAELFHRSMPYIQCVTINGGEPTAKVNSKWIAPLDEGSFDVRQVLRLLHEAGYRGPVGLQCYGIRTDAQDHLRRSMKIWRSWYPQDD
jgi:sugar phosphate isomerase/epimerase